MPPAMESKRMGGLSGNAHRRAVAGSEKVKGRLTGIASWTAQLD